MIIPPGFAHVRHLFEADGKADRVNVTHGLRLAAGVTDPALVASEILADWIGAFTAANLDSNWAHAGVAVTLGSDGGDGPSHELLTRTAGSRAGESAPINWAVLVRKQSALGGRRNRGRMFLPSGYVLDTEVTELGGLAGARQTTLQGLSNGFLTAIEAGVTYDRMVILHETAPSTPTVVTSLSVQSLGATQRRRMRR